MTFDIMTNNNMPSECLERWEDEGGTPNLVSPISSQGNRQSSNFYRLQKLRAKHYALKKEISKYKDQIYYDFSQLQDLKKKKLYLKDEIFRLQRA